MKTTAKLAQAVILTVFAVSSLAAVNAASATLASSHEKPVLDRGMTAEAVRLAVGEPLAVKPIAAPQGSAEIWTYRRLAHSATREVAATTKLETVFVGAGCGSTAEVSVPAYRLEHIRIYQQTALLMVDGKLTLARQWKETERNYSE